MANGGNDTTSVGGLLRLGAEVGTVIAAFVYFLGWTFFGNALDEFHVDPEEVGITPTWLLVRAIPVAFVLTLASAAIFVLARGARAAGTTLRRIVKDLLTILMSYAGGGIILLVLYMGLAWLVSKAFDITFPGPRFSGVRPFVDRHDDLVVTILLLTLVGLLISGCVAFVLLVIFDAPTQDGIRRRLTEWARGFDDAGEQLAKDSDDVEAGKDADRTPAKASGALVGWWDGLLDWAFFDQIPTALKQMAAAQPRQNSFLIASVIVLVSVVGHFSAAWAGNIIGNYVSDGNPIEYGPVLNWPEVTLDTASIPGGGVDASDRCLIKLGYHDGAYWLYSTEENRVEVVSAETVNVYIPRQGCREKSSPR